MRRVRDIWGESAFTVISSASGTIWSNRIQVLKHTESHYAGAMDAIGPWECVSDHFDGQTKTSLRHRLTMFVFMEACEGRMGSHVENPFLVSNIMQS